VEVGWARTKLIFQFWLVPFDTETKMYYPYNDQKGSEGMEAKLASCERTIYSSESKTQHKKNNKSSVISKIDNLGQVIFNALKRHFSTPEGCCASLSSSSLQHRVRYYHEVHDDLLFIFSP